MLTYTKFSCLSLVVKIRLREKFTAKYFTGENIPIYSTLIILWKVQEYADILLYPDLAIQNSMYAYMIVPSIYNFYANPNLIIKATCTVKITWRQYLLT